MSVINDKNSGAKLRRLIKEKGIVIAPGVYDAFSARMTELAGLDGAYVSGSSLHASMLASHDMDLLTLTEIVDQSRRIAHAVDIPVIVDGGSGYGDVANTIREVQLFEQAGAAAIQLDDEVIPYKCPWIYPDNKQKLVPPMDMCKKIEAACEARNNQETIIIARSDTQGSVYDTGDNSHLKEQIARLKEYVKAGAECIFPIASTYDDWKRVFDEVDAPYKLCAVSNLAHKGYNLREYSVEDWKNAGANIYIVPLFAIESSAKALRETLGEMKRTGDQPVEKFVSFEEYNEFLDGPAFLRRSKALDKHTLTMEK